MMSRRLSSRRAVAWLLALCALLATVAVRGAEPSVLLVIGDSVSAGYGLASGEGWVELLASKLKGESYPQRVLDPSISGDTTAGGPPRLPPLLKQHRPAVVVIELGGND